jgi:hypothetical protein
MPKFQVRKGFTVRKGDKVLAEEGEDVELDAAAAIGVAHMLEGIGPKELEALKAEAGVLSTDGEGEKKGKGKGKPAETK